MPTNAKSEDPRTRVVLADLRSDEIEKLFFLPNLTISQEHDLERGVT